MKPLFELRNVPIYQNKMFKTREAALNCTLGDVVLTQDPRSGIVVNVDYDPHILRYDETYQNEQGISPQFRDHLEQVLLKIAPVADGGDVLEVGCGKGLFVELMRNRGLQARGMDDAYEGQAPYIQKRHFGTAAEAPANVIVLRHVLEHIPNPVNFLRQIAEANGSVGLIYIEVPCLDWIMSNQAWFDVFYEHVNYFRIPDFQRIFDRIIDFGHLFGGQYLYVIADLSSLLAERPPADPASITFPVDFTRTLEILADNALAEPARQRVIWGAAAKGVMFAHHLSCHKVKFDVAIDINPGKQGCFLAATAIPVMAPDAALARLSPGSEIYVMNSNYFEEISSNGGNQFKYILVEKS